MSRYDDRGKTHVVHLSTVHLALDSRIFEREARALHDAGYRVTVVARHPTPEIIDGISIVPVRTPRSRIDRFLISPWSALRRCISLKPNIIHIHDPELVPLGLVLRLTGRTVIYDMHEDLSKQVRHKEWIPRILRSRLSALIEAIEPLALRAFQLVVIVPPAAADRLHVHKVNRTVLLRNFPRHKEYREQPSPSRKSIVAAITPGTVPIVYCGAITRIRGAIEMVTAIGRCDPSLKVRLILAGACAPELLTELESIPGWENCTYLGRIAPVDVPVLLEAAYAGLAVLHPTANYIGATPTKLFEYMAARLPIVCANFSPYDTTVEAHRCGILVDPMDTAAIAGAIEQLVRDPEAAHEMGMRGRDAVQSMFNWETESVRLIDAYDRLARIDS